MDRSHHPYAENLRLTQMTINSDRYLRFLGYSVLSFFLWIIGITLFPIDFDYFILGILITTTLLCLITVFLLLYIFEMLDPHENDELMDRYNQLKNLLTLKNLIVTAIVYALSKIYWFFSAHINHHAKEYIGFEPMGGKRKLKR